MENITGIEWTFPLAGFKFGRNTDIAKRILSNRDAALLILVANGGQLKTGEIQYFLKAWRPFDTTSKWRKGHTPVFTYLFNSYYGHITTKESGEPLKPYYSKQRTKVAYLLSVRRGIIGITHEGFKRLGWLKESFAANNLEFPADWQISV